MSEPGGLEGMARFGINTERALGVKVTRMRPFARRVGRDHLLARDLWRTRIHEARIFASMIDEPGAVTERQMELWAREFDSWDLVDQTCGNLFDKTPFAWTKAVDWSGRDEEFVKRAGFALIAYLAVHDKRAGDEDFTQLLPIIEAEADDDRNFVRKAVNWALRQIGKRSEYLRPVAIESAERILAQDTRSARWIARDALRELRRV